MQTIVILPRQGIYASRLFLKQSVACIVDLYTEQTMPAEKTVAVSFRVSPRFKQLLESAAERERRSQTNMLERLLFDYCTQQGIEAVPPTPKKNKAVAK